MIKRVRLENFKSHRDSDLKFGNLTVLTGLNSSGKSSVIQALLLLRQSFFKGSIWSGLDLNESLCSLGNGRDVHCIAPKDNTLKITIEDGDVFEFSFDAEQSLQSSFLRKSTYSSTISEAALSNISLFNKRFQYISTARFGGESHFESCDYEVNELRQLSKKFGQGEAVAQFLCRYGRDSVEIYQTEEGSVLLDEVVRWERMISPNLTISPQKDAVGNGFDIEYGYAYDGVKPIENLSAKNIGFGISHSLPIVVALLSAKKGDLVVIENPEAHLHPKGQSVLSELMVRAARAGVQIVVETHSDHVINAVSIAVKRYDDDENNERGLNKALVSMYHIFKDKDDPRISTMEEIVFENRGRIAYQPLDFFDQMEYDLAELSR